MRRQSEQSQVGKLENQKMCSAALLRLSAVSIVILEQLTLKFLPVVALQGHESRLRRPPRTDKFT